MNLHAKYPLLGRLYIQLAEANGVDREEFKRLEVQYNKMRDAIEMQEQFMANLTTKQAVDHLRQELKADSGYWHAWKSNIAESFLNELWRKGYKLPHDYEVANEAAENFLKQLTRED